MAQLNLVRRVGARAGYSLPLFLGLLIGLLALLAGLCHGRHSVATVAPPPVAAYTHDAVVSCVAFSSGGAGLAQTTGGERVPAVDLSAVR